MSTVRDLLLARADDTRPGLLFEERSWSWADVVRESAARAAALDVLLDPDRPPHVAVLFDNIPEFTFVLGGAALGGHVVVGLNSTRRGAALAADIARTDVQVVLTEPHLRDLLPNDLPVEVIDVTGERWQTLLAGHTAADVPRREVAEGDLLMLIFTSGTSGDPKAVRVTHQKIAGPGVMLGDRFGLSAAGRQDVAYVAMPMFHSNAIMAGWAPALATGSTVALARRFSATGFLPDVRRLGATYANYVGKPLTYVLATPSRPDDADNPLRLVFGNEANEGDIAAFAARFGCEVIDSYSSTENAVIVQRRPGMPAGSLGMPLPGIKVLSPETATETPDALFDPQGRLLNPDEAIGELVNTEGAGAFAGYYRDDEAESERMRGGMYWSGDLAYRDADGWVHFAGRTGDWLRVDGENLAAAPIERILLRHPAIAEAAVYAVPDEKVGDQVAAALVLRSELSASDLERFLAEQSDLQVKALPRFVRVVDSLPRTATNKVLKRVLSSEPLPASGAVWTREARGTSYH
ncbi:MULTISPECIES: long-chain-fatty-acid--CoA ligase [unclassified Nocardioides]|uniref:long-chain-fatty-acid--CoA ligase n=1 Tax=unclassified Nocardioides TaxID=2615069 RepID=UPI0006F9CBD7|nr:MULTISPECIES: long-chain-fatty-acid--CoA ligase [unclassified Nocardioides]KRA32782.1 acyl-CoA synthetase [Nocardioides sp. Root614]KRA89434.1 acyl-CoA synthetase [Nocardioides sp. Root682]